MFKQFHLTLVIFCSISLHAQNHIDFSQQEKKLVPLMGYNAHMTNAPKWGEEKLKKGIQKLSPSTLRFPGGSNSFYWDWKKGRTLSYDEFLPTLKTSEFKFDGKVINSVNELKSITIQERRKNPFWRQLYRYNAKTSNPETIKDFAAVLKDNNSEGVFTLNVISSNVSQEMEMIRQAKNSGLNIKYIEIGNEINSENLITKHFYPITSTYVDTCIIWMKEIWQEFPKMHIGIVGGNKNKRLKNWNELLADAFKKNFPNKSEQIHFVLHYYSNFKNPIYDYQDDTDYRKLISFPKMDLSQRLKWWHWNATERYSTWVTEFNMIEPKPWNLNNKWIHGLYISSQINELISQTNTEMLHFHSIGSSTFPVFASLNMMKNEEPYMQPTTSGIVTSLWNRLTYRAEHFNKLEAVTKEWNVNFASKLSCDCPNNPKVSTSISYNPVHAYVSMTKNKKKLLITNLSKEDITIDINTLLSGEISVEQYSGKLDSKIPKLKSDRFMTEKTGDNEIIIPALSISIFEE